MGEWRRQLGDKYWLSTIDDGDPVPEQVSLVHEVGGEDDSAPRLVLDQQFPDGPPRVGIHTRRGLIQHNNPEI